MMVLPEFVIDRIRDIMNENGITDIKGWIIWISI